MSDLAIEQIVCHCPACGQLVEMHRDLPVNPPFIAAHLVEDGSLCEESCLEIVVNTRDENGVKQPLDPGVAMAIAEAGEKIRQRYFAKPKAFQQEGE